MTLLNNRTHNGKKYEMVSIDNHPSDTSNIDQQDQEGQQLQEGQQDEEGQDQHKLLEHDTSSRLVTLTSWVCVFLGILSGALIGPAFKVMKLHHVPLALAASWRCQCMCFILIPIACLEYTFFTKIRVNWFTDIPEGYKYPTIYYMTVAGLAWSVNLLCWVEALAWISTVQGSIFTGMHPIFMVCYLGCSSISSKPGLLEWFGVMLAFVGLAVTCLDPEKGVTHDELAGNYKTMELYGRLLCIISSVAQVVIIMNRRVIKNVPVFQYTAYTTVIVATMSSLLAIYTLQSTWSIDDRGLFGWLSEKWILDMFIFGFMVGVITVSGFNFAMSHISPLVFATLQLLDPSVTGLVSWSISLEGIPGWFTIGGGVVVIGGVWAIIVGEHRRESLHLTTLDSGTMDSETIVCNLDSVDSTTLDVGRIDGVDCNTTSTSSSSDEEATT